MTWMARAISTCGCGKPDLLAANSWFKYRGGNRFDRIRVGSIGGRIRAGRFVRTSRTAQIVIAPGDGSGPLRFYECKVDPGKSESWVGHNLLDRDMIHGHTLDIGDVDHEAGRGSSGCDCMDSVWRWRSGYSEQTVLLERTPCGRVAE